VQAGEFDQMQTNYKAAVDESVTAIRLEEALASSNQTVAQIDQWEGAANREEEARSKAKAAKQTYESRKYYEVQFDAHDVTPPKRFFPAVWRSLTDTLA
jgi:cobalamin-dependent methionine synthase I